MKNLFKLVVIFVCLLSDISPMRKPLVKTVIDGQYSQTYSLVCDGKQHAHFSLNGNSCQWRQSITKKFTELILSWNALRPTQGKYIFYTNIKTGSWAGWQKFGEWGSDAQKSSIEVKHPIVHTKHVRVELQKKNFGTAFQVKVEAVGGARIQDVKRLHVCTSNEYAFSVKTDGSQLSSTHIKKVPRISQNRLVHPRFLDLCSPTSTCIALAQMGYCRGVLEEFVTDFAQKALDSSYLNIYGNWQFNVAQAFDAGNQKVGTMVARLNSFDQLSQFLEKGIVVPVSIRGSLLGAYKDMPNGHFVVVVGFDATTKRVRCLDPAFWYPSEMLKEYDYTQFVQAWGRSRNLCYIMNKP